MLSIIPNRSIVKISGVDSAKFLQNLVTNDLALSNNNAIYAMMLSPQGRFLFDMFIIPVENGYFLDVFTGTKDLLLKKLSMYKINMQVSIEDLEELKVCYASLNKAGDNVILEDAQRSSGISNIIPYKDPRHKELGYRIIFSHASEDGDSYLQDKYKYAIPDGGIDLLHDKAMPQEYGAEQLHAISYTKGCYVGQEVISRTKSQGVVRKKIYKVIADVDLSDIAHGTEITADGVKVGIFCSGYLKEGIALIREGDLGMIEDRDYILNDAIIKLYRASWYPAY